MNASQIVLSMVLATMVFSVALELRLDDFKRVAQEPKAVICGLIPQFILLPVATWAATLLLDLPPNVEAAMILVAMPPEPMSLPTRPAIASMSGVMASTSSMRVAAGSCRGLAV